MSKSHTKGDLAHTNIYMWGGVLTMGPRRKLSKIKSKIRLKIGRQ